MFGTADILSLIENLAELSERLSGLSGAIGALHDPIFDGVISALNELALDEAHVSASFNRLNDL